MPEPTVTPKDFRIDPLKPIEAHKAHFIWEAVDTSEETIKGKFQGYKVSCTSKPGLCKNI